MISIVMAYHNRYGLLDNTLTSIKTDVKDYEIIVVNDFSTESEDVNDLADKYPEHNIKIIHMADLGERWYNNPCVVNNAGFSHCQGDKIILQNPECYHVGDIIGAVDEYLTDHNYLSFHCYGTTEPELELMHTDWDKFMVGVNKNTSRNNGSVGWCNHAKYFPNNLNYTTAITRKNLQIMNGFDEVMATGRGGDDNEFKWRIQASPWKVQFVSQPWTIHQWHPKTLTNSKAMKTVNSNADKVTQIKNRLRAGGSITAHNDGKQIIKDIA